MKRTSDVATIYALWSDNSDQMDALDDDDRVALARIKVRTSNLIFSRQSLLRPDGVLLQDKLVQRRANKKQKVKHEPRDVPKRLAGEVIVLSD